MIKKITKIFICVVFIFGILNVSAQSTWDNVREKTKQETFVEYAAAVLPQLKEIADRKDAILTSQIDKLAILNHATSKSNSQILANNKLVLKLKDLIRIEQKGTISATNAKNIKSHMGEIEKLIRNNYSHKDILEQNKAYKEGLKKSTQKLKKEVLELNNPMKYIKISAKIVDYDEAFGAGFSTMGEFAAWTEGNSSFKNVMLRAAKEGGKAAVSIGAGAVAGSAAAIMSWNPFASGGAVVLGSVAAEGFYEASIGKMFENLMDREHDAINKYGADPEKLEKMREANKDKAYKEIKKILRDIADKQDDYNEELKNYIEERQRLSEEFEEEIRQDDAEQTLIEEAQTPIVAQKPNREKIKPGESVIFTIETTGGLLPIRYSGELSYKIENGYDRYLIAYKWTSEKDIEPGFYEFTVNATSASGKVGQNTVVIEVIGSKPAPEPIAKKEMKKEENTGSYLMKTDIYLKITNAGFVKYIYKYDDDEAIIKTHSQFGADLKPGSYDFEKVGEDNMGPDFSLTLAKETSGNSDKNIFSKTIKKVSGSISSDLKTLKMLTIEFSYIARADAGYNLEKGISYYSDATRNYKMVFENLPLYLGVSSFEYQKENNITHTFSVDLRGKSQIKKYLKSYSYDDEYTTKHLGSRTSEKFSHFDWDSAPENIRLIVKIGER